MTITERQPAEASGWLPYLPLIPIIGGFASYMANITGVVFLAWSGSMWGHNEFGWPQTYMKTELSDSQWEEAIEFRSRLADPDNKGVTSLPLHLVEEPYTFETGTLAANIILCVILLMILEWACWQVPFLRRRTHGLSLWKGIVLVASVGGIVRAAHSDLVFMLDYNLIRLMTFLLCLTGVGIVLWAVVDVIIARSTRKPGTSPQVPEHQGPGN